MDAHPYVLTALGVVGRGGEHPLGPALLRLQAGLMECCGGDAEVPWVTPHLVQRDEPVEGIEDGVLEAFGHRRPGELLETHDQLTFEVAAYAQEQQVMQEIKERGVQFGATAFRPTPPPQ